MPIPTHTFVADLVFQTMNGYRRNRCYYEPTNPLTDIEIVEFACNGVFNHFKAAFQALITSQVTFLRVEGRYFGSDGSDIEGNSTLTGVAGTISAAGDPPSSGDYSDLADTLPDEASLIVQVKTGKAGRGARGRRFICGLSEQIQNSGKIIVEYRPAAKALAEKFPEDVVIQNGATPPGTVGLLHARHWNRKDNEMMPITKAYAVVTIGTRKDRRDPLTLERI